MLFISVFQIGFGFAHVEYKNTKLHQGAIIVQKKTPIRHVYFVSRGLVRAVSKANKENPIFNYSMGDEFGSVKIAFKLGLYDMYPKD